MIGQKITAFDTTKKRAPHITSSTTTYFLHEESLLLRTA